MIGRLLRRPQARTRVAIIGLDCMEPSLLFGPWRAQLPALDALCAGGLWGRLESVVPAITVPAWSCMMSGQDPGALGIYGFRNRRDYGYGRLVTADSTAVRVPRLWDVLARHGKRSTVLHVPGTYPPPPIEGTLIGCFLTPGPEAAFTHPPELRDTLLARWGGDYPFDVSDFRSSDKAGILQRIHRLADVHFTDAIALAAQPDWDFFMHVDIGTDRVHHAFWSLMDAMHPHHAAHTARYGAGFADAIFGYYRLIDGYIARLLDVLPDDTHLFIVSDHGAQPMKGGIALNEWLIREGYLVLKTPPRETPARFDALDIDWAHTRVWGEGGYYGRVFLNIAGREPNGIVSPGDVPALLAELRARLEALGDADGRPIGTRCFTPDALYTDVNGIAPDLLVYFGDLAWRSIGSVGWGRVHVAENDTGPDEANHAQHGVFVYARKGQHLGGRRIDGDGPPHLLQIAPTVLGLYGVPVPAAMRRPPIAAVLGAAAR